MSPRVFVAITFVAVSSSASIVARADGDVDPFANTEAPLRPHAELPFAQVVDPSTPGRNDVAASYFGGTARREKYVQSAQLSFGATRDFAPIASITESGVGATGAAAGFLWRPIEGAFRLAFMPSGFRAVDASYGASMRVLASYDAGPVRFATNVLGAHTFLAGRDPIDVDVLFGVSVRAAKWSGGAFRAGFEYVGRDLEDAFDPSEADGGATHEFGPTLSLDLGSVQAVAGPSYVFHATGDTGALGGRFAMLAQF